MPEKLKLMVRDRRVVGQIRYSGKRRWGAPTKHKAGGEIGYLLQYFRYTALSNLFGNYFDSYTSQFCMADEVPEGENYYVRCQQFAIQIGESPNYSRIAGFGKRQNILGSFIKGNRCSDRNRNQFSLLPASSIRKCRRHLKKETKPKSRKAFNISTARRYAFGRAAVAAGSKSSRLASFEVRVRSRR